MVDVRRELRLINKHVRQHNREAGESIVWYEFLPIDPDRDTPGTDTDGWSHYDEIYDMGAREEGGRAYALGVTIPTIYVEEIEDAALAQEDGRQPTQNMRVVMLFQDVVEAGLTDPHEYTPHLNDIFLYDDRYYKVYNYRVRGRLDGDVVVGVDGFEVYLGQEFMFDPGPQAPTVQDLPWPATFP